MTSNDVRSVLCAALALLVILVAFGLGWWVGYRAAHPQSSETDSSDTLE